MIQYLELELPPNDVELKLQAFKQKWGLKDTKEAQDYKDVFFVNNAVEIEKGIADIEKAEIIYSYEYWKKTQKLNSLNFKKLGIEIRVCANLVYIASSDVRLFLVMPPCKFDEVNKMKKYYRIMQRILKIEGGK